MIVQNAPYSWTITTDHLHNKNVIYSKFIYYKHHLLIINLTNY
jgi:hypothetical protein